jgi:phosphatidylglycerophosphatase A
MRKESSDAIEQAVVETPHIVVPPRRRTAGDYVAVAVATCGVGYIPIAPGTWGAGVGVGIYLALGSATGWVVVNAAMGGFGRAVLPFQQTLTTLLLVAIVLVSLAGTWASTRAEKLLGKKDPGAVVVDEVAGQLITFLFVPWGTGPWAVVAGFLAFRLFDIWKPYPINRLEALPSGLGVMADDVLAGAYAATLMSLLVVVNLLIREVA